MKIGTRKVILNRNSSYLNLPAFWLRGQNVKPGDRLEIHLENDGSLRIAKGVLA